MIFLDGRTITKDIKEKLKNFCATLPTPPKLSIFYIGQHKAIDQFVKMKVHFGEYIGAQVDVFHFGENEDEVTILNTIKREINDSTGMIVQLPIPVFLSREAILSAVPKEKDVDLLSSEAFSHFASGDSNLLPGVVGAIDLMIKQYALDFSNKKIAILGKGKLVGQPIALWCAQKGFLFDIYDRNSIKIEALRNYDVIISGVGQPHFLKPEMVKEGVILFDAGTSEDGAVLVGDIDPLCYEKAQYVTPVPGGIGPLTVATLFVNLCRRVGYTD